MKLFAEFTYRDYSYDCLYSIKRAGTQRVIISTKHSHNDYRFYNNCDISEELLDKMTNQQVLAYLIKNEII